MTTNCVLLTIDSLRADHATEAAGFMPRLTEYANSGVRFTRMVRVYPQNDFATLS